MKKHLQKYLSGQTPDSFDERIIFIDIEWKQKGIRKRVCTMPNKWQHLRPYACQDTGAFWARVRKHFMERKLQRNSRKNWILSHCKRLTYSSVILPIRYFQRQSRYRLDSGGKEEAVTTSKVHSTTRRFSSRLHWQTILLCITIKFASGMRVKIRY